MSVDYAVTLTAFGSPAAIAAFRARARSKAPLTAELAPDLEATPNVICMQEVGDWRVGLNAALVERWSREHPELKFLLSTDKACGEECRDELYCGGELVARQTCWFDVLATRVKEGEDPPLLFRTVGGDGQALEMALEAEAALQRTRTWPWEPIAKV